MMGFLVVVIMLFAGVFGGAVNVALQGEAATRRTWILSIVTGVGASLLTPLFLGTVSSSLLREILSQTDASPGRFEKLFVYGGFCLLAAICSKAFIQTLSESVLQKVEQVKRQSEDAKRQAEDTEHELKQVRTTVEDVSATAEAARDAVQYQLVRTGSGKIEKSALGKHASVVGKSIAALESESAFANEDIEFGADTQDPWAGQFGNRSSTDHWRLEAKLRPVHGRPDLRTVSLTLYDLKHAESKESADRSHSERYARFYLHPTFANSKPRVPIVEGKAHLSVLSWGAFTVGVLVEEDNTKLELNLADLQEADEPWRSR